MPARDDEFRELEQLRAALEKAAIDALLHGRSADGDEAALAARGQAIEAAIRRREPATDADVEHLADCPHTRPERRFVGFRVDGSEIWQLWCRHCRARALYADGVKQESVETAPMAVARSSDPSPQDRRNDPGMADLIKRYLCAEREFGRVTIARMGECGRPKLRLGGIKSRIAKTKPKTSLAEIEFLAHHG